MKILLTLTFVALGFVAMAQKPISIQIATKSDTTAMLPTECGTASPSPEQAKQMLQSIREFETKLPRLRTASSVVVTIQFHVVKSPNNYAIDQSFITKFLQGLNIAFESTGIQFGQYGGGGNINYIQDQGKYFDFKKENENDLCDTRDARNAINVYFVNTINGSEKTGGYANFDTSSDYLQHPSNTSYSLSDRKYNRVFIAMQLVNNWQYIKEDRVKRIATKDLPHEMGHYFGLLHTFEPVHNNPGQTSEGDCNRTGDLICDTPFTLSSGGDTPSSSCGNYFLVFENNETKERTTAYPPYNNMMSYFYGCGNVFTPMQRERMRSWGYYLRIAQSVKNDNIDTRYYIDGNNHIGYDLITKNACAGQKVTFKLVHFGSWSTQDLQRLQMEISGPGVPRQLLPITLIDKETAEGTIPITAASGQHDIRITDRYSKTSDTEPVSKITINAQPSTPSIILTTQGLLSSAPAGNQWYVNGTALPGQTSPVLSATQPGTITVGVNVNGCTALSQPFVITGTESSGLQLVAFPNPATQSIQIKGLLPGSVHISAVDLSGKVLSESSYSQHPGIIDFPVDHSFGKMFVLKVENESRTWSQRIAVNK